MGEDDVAKVGIGKTKLIVSIIVILIVITCFFALSYSPQVEDIMPTPPSLLFNTSDNNYSFNVTISHIIDEDSRVNLTTWTNITNIYYIVSNSWINLSSENLAYYINEKPDNVILDSGNFMQIISNDSGFINYIDSDSNKFLNEGDIIHIDKNIMSQNDTALILTIVYYGDLEGELSNNRYIAINGVVLVSPYDMRGE